MQAFASSSRRQLTPPPVTITPKQRWIGLLLTYELSEDHASSVWDLVMECLEDGRHFFQHPSVRELELIYQTLVCVCQRRITSIPEVENAPHSDVSATTMSAGYSAVKSLYFWCLIRDEFHSNASESRSIVRKNPIFLDTKPSSPPLFSNFGFTYPEYVKKTKLMAIRSPHELAHVPTRVWADGDFDNVKYLIYSVNASPTSTLPAFCSRYQCLTHLSLAQIHVGEFDTNNFLTMELDVLKLVSFKWKNINEMVLFLLSFKRIDSLILDSPVATSPNGKASSAKKASVGFFALWDCAGYDQALQSTFDWVPGCATNSPTRYKWQTPTDINTIIRGCAALSREVERAGMFLG